MIGFSEEEVEKVKELVEKENYTKNRAARMVRSVKEGLLLLYPISKNSRPENNKNSNRAPLYEDSSDTLARNLIGLAISFPKSDQAQPTEKYIVGTIPWRSADDI